MRGVIALAAGLLALTACKGKDSETDDTDDASEPLLTAGEYSWNEETITAQECAQQYTFLAGARSEVVPVGTTGFTLDMTETLGIIADAVLECTATGSAFACETITASEDTYGDGRRVVSLEMSGVGGTLNGTSSFDFAMDLTADCDGDRCGEMVEPRLPCGFHVASTANLVP